MHSNVLSTAVPICSSPSWCSELPLLMPSSPHLLSSCTNASLGPLSLPKSATLTQKPSKFTNELLPILTPPNHRLINTAMYDTLYKIWVPVTVVCVLPQDSYQICTSNGTIYCHMRQHWCECSVKPADTVPDTTTATLLAPARPHVSAPQPAPTRAAQPMLPVPVAPAKPVTLKPQTTAVPTMPAVPKVVPVPMAVTPSIAPVLPRGSGHACIPPKHLIQEM